MKKSSSKTPSKRKALEKPKVEKLGSFLSITLSKKSTPGDGVFACGTKG